MAAASPPQVGIPVSKGEHQRPAGRREPVAPQVHRLAAVAERVGGGVHRPAAQRPLRVHHEEANLLKSALGEVPALVAIVEGFRCWIRPGGADGYRGRPRPTAIRPPPEASTPGHRSRPERPRRRSWIVVGPRTRAHLAGCWSRAWPPCGWPCWRPAGCPRGRASASSWANATSSPSLLHRARRRKHDVPQLPLLRAVLAGLLANGIVRWVEARVRRWWVGPHKGRMR